MWVFPRGGFSVKRPSTCHWSGSARFLGSRKPQLVAPRFGQQTYKVSLQGEVATFQVVPRAPLQVFCDWLLVPRRDKESTSVREQKCRLGPQAVVEDANATWLWKGGPVLFLDPFEGTLGGVLGGLSAIVDHGPPFYGPQAKFPLTFLLLWATSKSAPCFLPNTSSESRPPTPCAGWIWFPRPRAVGRTHDLGRESAPLYFGELAEWLRHRGANATGLWARAGSNPALSVGMVTERPKVPAWKAGGPRGGGPKVRILPIPQFWKAKPRAGDGTRLESGRAPDKGLGCSIHPPSASQVGAGLYPAQLREHPTAEFPVSSLCSSSAPEVVSQDSQGCAGGRPVRSTPSSPTRWRPSRWRTLSRCKAGIPGPDEGSPATPSTGDRGGGRGCFGALVC